MRYWGIRIGVPGDPDQFVLIARKYGFISIGWNDLKDISRFKNKEELKKHYENVYGSSDPSSIKTLWDFANELNVGDIVLVPHLDERAERVVYVGRIAGPYVYFDKWIDICGHHHRRRTEWVKEIWWDTLSEQLRNTLSTPQTLRNLDDYRYEIEFQLIQYSRLF